MSTEAKIQCASDIQAIVRDLERTIADDRSLTAWHAAHEELNAAGVDGPPGLVARIRELVDSGKLYDAVVREDLAAAYRTALDLGAQLDEGAPMPDVARACFEAGRRAGMRSRQSED